MKPETYGTGNLCQQTREAAHRKASAFSGCKIVNQVDVLRFANNSCDDADAGEGQTQRFSPPITHKLALHSRSPATGTLEHVFTWDESGVKLRSCD